MDVHTRHQKSEAGLKTDDSVVSCSVNRDVFKSNLIFPAKPVSPLYRFLTNLRVVMSRSVSLCWFRSRAMTWSDNWAIPADPLSWLRDTFPPSSCEVLSCVLLKCDTRNSEMPVRSTSDLSLVIVWSSIRLSSPSSPLNNMDKWSTNIIRHSSPLARYSIRL